MKKRYRRPSKPRVVLCVVCKKEFVTRHSQGKYCSWKCRRIGERSSWNLYSYRNRDKRRNYEKKYYVKNRDAVLKRTKAYAKTPAGKKAAIKARAFQIVKNPERVFCRSVLTVALRVGYVRFKPCQVCGEFKVYAHHTDYTDPFKVIWLCEKHHLKVHGKTKSGPNTRGRKSFEPAAPEQSGK